ncbi:MAG: hypothetical protein K2N06_02160 [Oscillospiraceae bacterium]|nr:hypothetical protein [Oscillospiraceae bacterium]
MNRKFTPKKLTIASGIALILLVVLIVVLVFVSRSGRESAIPSRVTLYRPETSEIVTLSYEDFLCGCVAGLLPEGQSQYNAEALRAIAIAENSRALYVLNNRGTAFTAPYAKVEAVNFGADFVTNAYFPYISTEISVTLRTAVQNAMNSVLTLDGEPISAPMCKISAGRTDEDALSPSVALPCDIDEKGFESRMAFTPDEILSALHNKGVLSADCSKWFGKAAYSDSGTLMFIEFGEMKYTGAELRRLLGLRSTAITVQFAEDKFCFICRGFGENRGMSISAANFLAKTGKTAEEILAVFYPNCEIVKE